MMKPVEEDDGQGSLDGRSFWKVDQYKKLEVKHEQKSTQESQRSMSSSCGYMALGFSSGSSLEIDNLDEETHFDDIDTESVVTEPEYHAVNSSTPPDSPCSLEDEDSPPKKRYTLLNMPQRMSPLSFKKLPKIEECDLPSSVFYPSSPRMQMAFDLLYGFIFVAKGVALLVVIVIITCNVMSSHHQNGPMIINNMVPAHARHAPQVGLTSTTSHEELKKLEQEMIRAQINVKLSVQGEDENEGVVNDESKEALEQESSIEAEEDEEEYEESSIRMVDGMILTGKIESVCDDENDEETFDLTKCWALCEPSECCFNDDIPCSHDLVGCEPYMYCDVLIGPTDFASGHEHTTEELEGMDNGT